MTTSFGQPLVCHKEPIIGHKRSLYTPFIGKKKPLVDCRMLRGVTLVELVITLAVIGVLATVAVPSFRQFLESGRLTTATNDLLGDFNLARAEAIKRQQGQVVMCVSTTGTGCTASSPWSSGWMVFWDNNTNGSYAVAENDILLKIHSALPSGIATGAVPANTGLIAFNRLGAQNAITSLQITNSTLSATRRLCFNTTGRVLLLREGLPSCT
jgi:type IV fimbrial biogenesis protein FimT